MTESIQPNNTPELTLYQTNDGVELIINQQSGESFATQRGYARMSGINQSTVSRRCKKGDAENIIENARVQTKQAIRDDATLIPEPTILDWLRKDNPQLLTSFAQLGLRATLHKWAGFEVNSSAQQVPQSYLEALKATVKAEEARLQEKVEKEQVQASLEDAESKLTVYRSILSPGSCLTVKQVADSLAIPNLGRNKLFQFLRNIRFVCQGSLAPTREQIEKERAVVHQYSIERSNGRQVKDQTRLTFKGVEYVIKKLKQKGYRVKVNAEDIWEQNQEDNQIVKQ